MGKYPTEPIKTFSSLPENQKPKTKGEPKMSNLKKELNLLMQKIDTQVDYQGIYIFKRIKIDNASSKNVLRFLQTYAAQLIDIIDKPKPKFESYYNIKKTNNYL